MNDWLKVKVPEEKTGILTPGKSAVLYLCPRDYWKKHDGVWRGDIGSLRVGTDAIPVWRSAIGRHSPFDGMTFGDILKDYEICFTEVPPLELGRFPSPLGISHEQREANCRAHINRVLDDLK